MSLDPAPSVPVLEPPTPIAPVGPPSRAWAVFLSVLSPGLGLFRLGRARLGWGVFAGVCASIPLVRFGFGAMVAWVVAVVACWFLPLFVRRGRPEPGGRVFGHLVARVILATLWRLVVIAFVVEAFKSPSGSMLPTLEVGDHFMVDKLGVRLHAPERGELITFTYPRERQKQFVKRVVAVGGDRVRVKDNQLFVNDVPVPRVPVAGPCELEDYDEQLDQWTTQGCARFHEILDGHAYDTIDALDAYNKDFPGQGDPDPYVVPPDSFFVLGDNRNNSHDSRFWGPVARADVLGRPIYIWYSSGPDGIRGARIGQTVR